MYTNNAVVSTQLNGFNYCYVTLIIIFNINHLFLNGSKYCYVSVTILAQSAGAVEYTEVQRGKTPTQMSLLEYDTKQSDGEVSVMLELWGIRSIPSLPLLPDPLGPAMVASNRAIYMG